MLRPQGPELTPSTHQVAFANIRDLVWEVLIGRILWVYSGMPYWGLCWGAWLNGDTHIVAIWVVWANILLPGRHWPASSLGVGGLRSGRTQQVLSVGADCTRTGFGGPSYLKWGSVRSGFYTRASGFGFFPEHIGNFGQGIYVTEASSQCFRRRPLK